MIIDAQKLKLSDTSDLQISRETIGRNQYPLLIVDNFYAHPEYVHQLAQSLYYENPKGMHIHASSVISLSTGEIYDFIHEHYAKSWRVGRDQLLGLSNKWRFFRSVPSGSSLPTIREDPHADGKFLFAGLIYLTPDAYCKGGTGYYRHRLTGAEEKPPSATWLRRAKVPPSIIQKLNEYDVHRSFKESGQKDYDKFMKSIPSKTTGNKYHLAGSNETWQLTKMADMKFNRLIVYPAFVLHKAIFEEDWFDGEISRRRLTQNFFFKFPEIKPSIFNIVLPKI